MERWERLARAAAPLKPAEAPYYVSHPQEPHTPAVGWYWTPAGLEHPSFLAADAVTAEIKLLQLAGRLPSSARTS